MLDNIRYAILNPTDTTRYVLGLWLRPASREMVLEERMNAHHFVGHQCVWRAVLFVAGHRLAHLAKNL